ncbi:MAG: hypothetical protein JWO74_1590 [Solirubrobacterales bacterium]|nr:hypothetical protein [Solirubrobacterales bacterium]
MDISTATSLRPSSRDGRSARPREGDSNGPALRARHALVFGLGLALVILALHAATASAGQVNYCGILVAPYSPCTSSTSGVYNYNEASYPGTGTVSVCEKVYDQYGLVSRFCHDNVAGSGGQIGVSRYFDMYVGNNSGNQHTVDGKGLY